MKRLVNNFCKSALGLIMIGGVGSAYAAEGYIDYLEAEASDTYQSFQIYMKDGLKICTESGVAYNTTAYMDKDAKNFNTMVTVAMTAHASGRKVKVYGSYSPSEGNRCILKKIIMY